MTSKNKLKYLFIGVVIILATFALADSLGFFSQKAYTEVSHGSHVHYVPFDRDPDVPINNFPTRAPGPDEKITPDGKIVLK